MSMQSSGPFNPQASVKEQFQILSRSKSVPIASFANKTLEFWHGRDVSNEDISIAIDIIAQLVENAIQPSALNNSQSVLAGVLKTLQESASQIQRINSVSREPLGQEPGIKLETVLASIDQSTLPSHPAFHSDWTVNRAEDVLQLPSVPIGSYALIGMSDSLTVVVKEAHEQVSCHLLSKAEGKGLTIKPFQEKIDCNELDEDCESQKILAILDTLVIPLGEIKPQIMSLLLFKEKLEKVALFLRKAQIQVLFFSVFLDQKLTSA